MKRFICLLIVFLLVLCGCAQDVLPAHADEAEFSYKVDCSYYKDGPGVIKSGFVNTEKTELKTPDQAIELAKKECSVEYDTIFVSFDPDLRIYRVSFFKGMQLGGDQTVYINEDGITLMCVYGE